MKSAFIIVNVPCDTGIEDVLEAITGLGKALKCRVEADVRWMPISPERHTNQGVIKIPHRRRQFMHSRLSDPPEAA